MEKMYVLIKRLISIVVPSLSISVQMLVVASSLQCVIIPQERDHYQNSPKHVQSYAVGEVGDGVPQLSLITMFFSTTTVLPCPLASTQHTKHDIVSILLSVQRTR